MSKNVKTIFGAATLGNIGKYTSSESEPKPDYSKEQETLDILTRNNVKDLDTACSYDGSEEALGKLNAPATFTIHTKARGFAPGTLKKDSILASAEESFKRLGTDSVETYFVHSPDPETPVEETMEAIQELYKAGRFKHFGASNFKAEQVRRLHDYAATKSFVLPTVYQGNYNPVSRHIEKDLFPLLRELKICFQAYSPLAGGFLVKSPETIKNGGRGRWDPSSYAGQLYHRLYNKKSLVDALREWEAIATEFGVSKAALAYRFVAYSSALSGDYGDGMIIGARKPEQLEQTLESISAGPLPDAAVTRIEKVWDLVKDEAPVDNYHL